jgi:hypothetical protein
MKKSLVILILLLTLLLGGCENFTLPSDLTVPTNITTDEGQTSELETSEVTTEEISTNTETSSEEVTTIISDEIYLKLNAGQDTVEINDEWTDAGAVFVINDEEYVMSTTDSVDTSSIDVYTITYEYEYNDIVYSMTRIVVVLDQVAPEIELNLGVDTIVVGNEWVDAGVTIIDNSKEDITPTIEGQVDINTPGTYEITYTATDSSGNDTSITRYVTVIE